MQMPLAQLSATTPQGAQAVPPNPQAPASGVSQEPELQQPSGQLTELQPLQTPFTQVWP